MVRASRELAPPLEVTEIVSCIGVQNTIKLLELRGGTRLYVPQPANIAGCFLAEHFDEVSLMRLAGAFGGTRIQIPLCREWRARYYLGEGGRSHSEIALRVGVTQSFVQRLANSDWVPLPRTHRGLQDAARPLKTDQLELFGG